MDKNKKILNEAFFGKEKDTHYDKLLKSLPQYSALDSKGEPVYKVSDTEEMKKRLAGTFGVTFGNNSIRSMANKAIKTFPIIISDAVEVETGVILKKLMEEQYAEYINMLVSNQVIDLSGYSASEEKGNVAIQALDSISGTDFSKSRVADTAARTGKVEADDVFKNIPLYQLLREQNEVISCGDPTMDALLENAIIVEKEEDVKKVTDYLMEAFSLGLNDPSTLRLTKIHKDGNAMTLGDRVNQLSAKERGRAIDRLESELDDLDNKGKKYKDLKRYYGGAASKPDFDFYANYSGKMDAGTIARNIDLLIGQISDGLAYSLAKDNKAALSEAPQAPITSAQAIISQALDGMNPEEREAMAAELKLQQAKRDAIDAEFTEVNKKETKADDKEKNTVRPLEPKKAEDQSESGNGELGKSRAVMTLLTSPDAILGSERDFDSVMNRSIGEMLLDPRNEAIRDRFEKATFLLQARRIAGIEYYNYLTMRLGIPVSDSTRTKLVTQFRIKDVRTMTDKYHEYDKDEDNPNHKLTAGFKINKDDLTAIANNQRLITPIVKSISRHKVRHVVSSIGGGTIVGGTAAFIALAASAPVIWPFVAAGAASGAVGGFLISTLKAIREKARLKKVVGKIEGWERVEALIVEMEKQQEEVRSIKGDKLRKALADYEKAANTGREYKYDDPNKREMAQNAELEQIYGNVKNLYQQALAESVDETTPYAFDSYIERLNEDCANNAAVAKDAVIELLEGDQETTAALFEQVSLNELFGLGKNRGTFTTPVKTKYIEAKPDKTALVVPAYMSRTQYAYGSTEIERRDVKDRKYNQPLIMTVRFRERFSDGKLSDNQLTAVIGILGKVIRVPSSEMEEILRQNANGSTIAGFFKDSKGDLRNVIADMIGKAKKEASNKNLSKSGDIWRNLEKVATLAAANTMAGRKSNNIANAHIVFAQKEIDDIRNELGVDYLKDTKYAGELMKRYSAFTLMVANDPGQRVYILDDKDNISWDAVPYSAIRGREGGDSLDAALAKLQRLN